MVENRRCRCMPPQETFCSYICQMMCAVKLKHSSQNMITKLHSDVKEYVVILKSYLRDVP